MTYKPRHFGKPTIDVEKIYFVLACDNKETTLFQLLHGFIQKIPGVKLPVGVICHHIERDIYMYDACCTVFSPKFLPDFNSIAIYIRNLEPMKDTYNGSTILRADFGPRIGEESGPHIYQDYKNFTSDGKYTFESFIQEKKNVNGDLTCWITPKDNQWSVLPCFDLPLPIRKYKPVYDKMKIFRKTYYRSKKNSKSDQGPTKIGFGIVMLPGKIVINGNIVLCPLHLQLGSTYMCKYVIQKHPLEKISQLISYKSFTLPNHYLQTFVVGNCVLIKTIIMDFVIRVKDQESQKSYAPFLSLNVTPKADDVNEGSKIHNFTTHPLLGQIIFPKKMVYSSYVHGVKVILGFCVCAEEQLETPSEVKYRVLAVHDGATFLRVPDIPDTMYQAKNILIDMKLKKIGDPPGIPSPVEQHRHAPKLRTNGWLCVARLLSLRYIIPYEYNKKVPEPRIIDTDICNGVKFHGRQIKPHNRRY